VPITIKINEVPFQAAVFVSNLDYFRHAEFLMISPETAIEMFGRELSEVER
jgi:hypothetical protein